MAQRDPALEPFDRLIGTWATAATHPLFDGVVSGSITFEWLEGGHFLVQRSRNDHELFPDAICVIGAPEDGEGLVMEYFDSRGVRRTYGVSLEGGVLRIWRDDPGFAQRYAATIAGDRFEGRWQLAREPGDWQDDLAVTYRRRAGAPVRQVLAALAVTEMGAAEAWYERLFGRPADAHPMDGLVEWHFGPAQVVQLVADPQRAGGSLATLFVDDLGGEADAVTTAGAEFRSVDDPDGNRLTLLRP